MKFLTVGHKGVEVFLGKGKNIKCRDYDAYKPR
jgi:hypothetical protein